MQISGYGYAPDAIVFDAATGRWSLKPDYNLVTDRVYLTATDDDQFIDGDAHANEVGEDTNQTGAVYTTDGTLIKSGRWYDEQYYGLQAPGGGPVIYIEKLEIGGMHVGWIVTQPLAEGVDYAQVDQGDVYHDQYADSRLSYSDIQSVPCFGPGTMITTAGGEVPVEWLRAGDGVVTRDHGVQPLLWLGRYETAPGHAGGPGLIEIAPGAFGLGLPRAQLRLSPNHRVLLGGASVELFFGADEVLAAAKFLTDGAAVRAVQVPGRMLLYHLLFAEHEVILADGLWSESLYLGDAADGWPLPEAPHFGDGGQIGHRQTARRCLRAHEARLLARPISPPVAEIMATSRVA